MKALLKGATKGLPQTGLQGGAGVGVFYLHRMLTSKVDFLQKNPLAAPIGFVLLGHLLKKSSKLGSVASALIGAGGYAGAQVFEVKKAMQQQAPAAAAPSNTSGFDDDDTGALTSPGDIGALLNPGNIGEFDENSSYADAYTL
jgi:hypothetical protein